MSDIILTKQELVDITGRRRAADQLLVLHARGFHRAEILAGKLRLERAHYDAVCRGSAQAAAPAGPKMDMAALQRHAERV